MAPQNFDLNLLQLLDVLYEERSVSRAAERLFLTPSAISHALRRMRLMLDDRLFTRGPKGMTPTPRVHEIARRLHSILPQLYEVLMPVEFSPLTTERTFLISCVPYLASVMIPSLAASFHRAAPHALLDIKPLREDVVDDIDSGVLDVALGNFRRAPAKLIVEELLSESSVWVMSRANPASGKKLTLQRLAQLPHIDISIGGVSENPVGSYEVRQGLERLVLQNNLGAVDAALARSGLQRHVRWRAPDSLSAIAIAAHTGGACLVPQSVARLLSEPMGIKIFDPPYRSIPLTIQMLYHSEALSRPAVRWLLDCIRSIAVRSA